MQSGYQHPDLVDLEFKTDSIAVKSPVQRAPTNRSVSLTAEAPPFFAPSSSMTTARPSAVETPLQPATTDHPLSLNTYAASSFVPSSFTTSRSGSMHSVLDQYHRHHGALGLHTGPGDVSAPFSGHSSFANQTYSMPDPNPCESMSPSTRDPYQQTFGLRGPYSVNYSGAQTMTDPRFFSTAEVPRSMPDPSSQAHSTNFSASRAIPIVKPAQKVFDEAFSRLPSAPKQPSQARIAPPPGLSPAHGASQGTFDALLPEPKDGMTAPSVAKLRPPVDRPNADPSTGTVQLPSTDELKTLADDTLSDESKTATRSLSIEDEQQTVADSGIDEPSGDHASATENESKPKASLKKNRRKARHALTEAWAEREKIRKRVAATHTLDGVRALKDATATYNEKRVELVRSMASGELPEEDAQVFPILSGSDLSAPRVRPARVQLASLEDSLENAKATLGEENTNPWHIVSRKKADPKIQELTTKALNARNVYADAHAYFQRQPPPGRARLKDLRAQGEARIERAANYYAQKRADLTAAYGGELPPEWKEQLWTYDDKAARKSRDSWGLESQREVMVPTQRRK